MSRRDLSATDFAGLEHAHHARMAARSALSSRDAQRLFSQRVAPPAGPIARAARRMAWLLFGLR